MIISRRQAFSVLGGAAAATLGGAPLANAQTPAPGIYKIKRPYDVLDGVELTPRTNLGTDVLRILPAGSDGKRRTIQRARYTLRGEEGAPVVTTCTADGDFSDIAGLTQPSGALEGTVAFAFKDPKSHSTLPREIFTARAFDGEGDRSSFRSAGNELTEGSQILFGRCSETRTFTAWRRPTSNPTSPSDTYATVYWNGASRFSIPRKSGRASQSLLAVSSLTGGGAAIAYMTHSTSDVFGQLFIQRLQSNTYPDGEPFSLGSVAGSIGLAPLPDGVLCAVWPVARTDGPYKAMIASRLLERNGTRSHTRYARLELDSVEEAWRTKVGLRAASTADGRVVVVAGGSVGEGDKRVRAVKAYALDPQGGVLGAPVTLASVKDPDGTATPLATWGLVRQSPTSFVAAWRGGETGAQACRLRVV